MHCYECENETTEPADIIQHNNTIKQRIVKTHRLKDSKISLPTEKVVVGGCGGLWWMVVGGGGWWSSPKIIRFFVVVVIAVPRITTFQG